MTGNNNNVYSAQDAEKRWISSELLFGAVEEIIASGTQASFTVTGMSMWPLICHGRDSAVVEKASLSNLSVGDIVLLKTVSGKYLLHRITKLNGEKIRTTGDGNFFHDGWFPKDCVIAKVVQVKRPDRTINVDRFGWKVYGRIWMLLFPVRRPMFALWKQLRKVV